MAVYERNYKRYTGVQTPTSTRFLILPRYIFKDVFRSRWMVVFYVACFAFPLLCALFIYLTHNADFLKAIPNFQMPDFLQIKADFFRRFLAIQGMLAFGLTIFIGPGLISRDLANNGLPLYLSRPFSRKEYVIGKMAVLAILLSAITWVAGWLLMLLHANFVGLSWLTENLQLFIGFFIGAWMWILALGLLALAASAWVKWRAVAGFAMLAVVLGGAFFGSVMVRNLFETEYGHLLNLIVVIERIWVGLLGIESSESLPLAAAWVAFASFLCLCIFLLNRKIRAYEVIS